MLFFIFTFIKVIFTKPFSEWYRLIKVSITNSVIFLFKLELKQFNISKILPMWKIGVYIVLIMNILL